MGFLGTTKMTEKIDMEELKAQLKRHEGLRLGPYLDTQGVWTIGYGHTGPISLHLAEELLREDIASAVSDFYRLPAVFQKLSANRKRVIVNMIFNMGLPRLRTFKRFFAAIERGDHKDASNEMLDSRWAEQVGNRAKELAQIYQEG